jgi:hypothetical protein
MSKDPFPNLLVEARVDERKREQARIAYYSRPLSAVEQVVIEAPEPPDWPEIKRIREDEDGRNLIRGFRWAVPISVLVWIIVLRLWK